MSGGEKCYRETQHAQGAGVRVCVGGGGMEGGGKQVPSLKPSFQTPVLSPLCCLTLDSVRTQAVYREDVQTGGMPVKAKCP